MCNFMDPLTIFQQDPPIVINKFGKGSLHPQQLPFFDVPMIGYHHPSGSLAALEVLVVVCMVPIPSPMH